MQQRSLSTLAAFYSKDAINSPLNAQVEKIKNLSLLIASVENSLLGSGERYNRYIVVLKYENISKITNAYNFILSRFSFDERLVIINYF